MMSSVNAVIITYNQASYIERSISGAIDQKLSHDYKIILHDDASTDGTAEICRKFKERYPALIDLILCPKNKGMAKSWIDALSAAESKYVAICEGDDYWCNENKLQQQVDFLEANPDYSICCHKVYFKKNERRATLMHDEFMPASETTYNIEMMATYGNLVATPSVVYRNHLYATFPSWFSTVPIADYVLHLLNAQYGKIKYLPEPMAVLRQHSKGAWSGQTAMTNASNMMKVLGLLLTEPFNEVVKKGLQNQLRVNKAIYLKELMNKSWDKFCIEFDKMMNEDRSVAVALIEKMKAEADTIHQTRSYKAIAAIKKIAGVK